MSDFVTHDAVETIDGSVERVGGTRRRRVVAPGLTPPDDDVVRVDVAGTTYRAPVSETTDGDLSFTGAYETPTMARNRSGTDHLAAFFENHDLVVGRTVHVDVVEEGFRYGVRAPGQRATYESTGKPKSSLADIARSIDE